MTDQYLVGELSVLLARLQQTTTSATAASDVARLRHDAETCPPAALGSVVVHALALVDALCWDALARGDATAFAVQGRAGTDLRLFAACASLLPER